MKYYVYVSDAKVSMLHAQIAQSTNRNREASLGFDVKVLKGHLTESRGLPENAFTRLDEVVRELRASKLVGSIEEPRQFIGASLPMTWSTYGFSMSGGDDSQITFWGYCEQPAHPFAGTVLALAGSKYHLIGEQRSGNAHSHSITPAMTEWFLENLDDPFDKREDAPEGMADALRGSHRLSEYDVANGAWLAATQASGAKGTYEFVAKVLSISEWPEGFRGSKTRRVILASPLYVSMNE